MTEEKKTASLLVFPRAKKLRTTSKTFSSQGSQPTARAAHFDSNRSILRKFAQCARLEHRDEAELMLRRLLDIDTHTASKLYTAYRAKITIELQQEPQADKPTMGRLKSDSKRHANKNLSLAPDFQNNNEITQMTPTENCLYKLASGLELGLANDFVELFSRCFDTDGVAAINFYLHLKHLD